MKNKEGVLLKNVDPKEFWKRVKDISRSRKEKWHEFLDELNDLNYGGFHFEFNRRLFYSHAYL